MAAGLGFKTFTTGEVLTAGDVNGYLMQGILVFASEAARDSSITSPQEGQFAFTKDNNSLWYYTGSAWAASGATGDIEGVTAGVGISGGGTSGTVTITNSMATAIDAKGDLVVGTGADTFSRLAVGTNNYVLTADSAEATGMKWAAAAGGGKVLQVVQASTTSGVTIASTSYTDSNLSATITPTSASSKILVLVSQSISMNRDAQEMYNVSANLLRGATQITELPNFFWFRLGSNADTALRGTYTINYLDNPSTTSATTYKTQGKCEATANNQTVRFQSGSVPSTMTLLEIGA
jgi:hypothetical protein